MIKSIKPWQLLYLLLLLLTACKEEFNIPEPERGLDVRVVNSKNQPVPNAEVSVYTSASDWENEKNSYVKGVTGGTGSIHLSGISADSLWIKATWIDLVTKEVYQNTMVSFEPVSPLPANSKAIYQIKINSAKVLKGILIKQAEYSDNTYNTCDRYYHKDFYWCGHYSKIKDVSGQACDLYLMIENSTSPYNDMVSSYFYRSDIQIDVASKNITFEVNDTITDFRKPYYIGVREHFVLNPESYTGVSCYNGYSTYANLGEYLASREGQEYTITSVDSYLNAKAPLLNVKNSALTSYPADEITIKLSNYNDAALKLTLEWIYE